jgi:CBS domain-containing protein
MTIAQSPLAHVHVRDVMNTGILTTDPSTSLRVVARLMSEQRVHAVAVADPESTRRPWGIVSTSDIVAAAAAGTTGTAGEAARTETATVSSAEPVEYAAQIMAEKGLTHLIVVNPETGHPTGVLSSLDIVAAYGG